MPIIKPVSDLRNKFTAISRICHEEHQPVFLTKNGEGDLVVMSIEDYEKQTTLLELYQKLGEAEAIAGDGKYLSHDDVMAKLRRRINEKA